MVLELISVTDPRWRTALHGFQHDFYHLPEYLQLCGRHEGGEPVAAYSEEGGSCILAPLLLRPLPLRLGAPKPWRDATTPYGYAAPLVGEGTTPDTLSRFLVALRRTLRDIDVATLFMRLHPILPIHVEPFAEHGEVVDHGSTVTVDLARSAAEMWSDTRANHRRGINKLTRAGYRVVFDEWSRLDAFADIYRATMRRVDAREFYLFSDSYFQDLRDALGDRLHLTAVLDPGGKQVCGGLFTTVGKIMQYHLGGTAPSHLKDAPSKLMFHEAGLWGKERECRWLHLGGGVGGGDDALMHFKSGFSPLRNRFRTIRMVIDESKYENLIGHWRKLAGVAPPSEYFPVYRADPDSGAETGDDQ